MAEQFLTLMADLDDEAQARMSGWYHSLQEAGFTGVQTPGLPYHISLSTFPLDQEKEAAEIAVSTVKEYKNTTGSDIKVIFNVFKDDDLMIYQDLLNC